jgi:hypothetical protein
MTKNKKIYKTLYVRIRIENKEWIEEQVSKDPFLSEASFIDKMIASKRKASSARRKKPL